MDATLAAAQQLYQAGNHLFAKALEGLEREDLFKAPGDANPLIWLAGHLTYCRCSVYNLVGGKRELAWPKLFGRYSKIVPREDYPPIDEIKSLWEELKRGMKTGFEEIDEGRLSENASFDIPVKDKSVRSAIAFLAWHEAYHIGQMAYVRKWLGKGGLIDG